MLILGYIFEALTLIILLAWLFIYKEMIVLVLALMCFITSEYYHMTAQNQDIMLKIEELRKELKNKK